jgi:hypothetical protein
LPYYRVRSSSSGYCISLVQFHSGPNKAVIRAHDSWLVVTNFFWATGFLAHPLS